MIKKSKLVIGRTLWKATIEKYDPIKNKSGFPNQVKIIKKNGDKASTKKSEDLSISWCLHKKMQDPIKYKIAMIWTTINEAGYGKKLKR